MLSRRLLFGFSVGAAAALYTLLFVLAPNIEMMHAGIRPERLPARFTIYLRDPGQFLQPDTEGDLTAFRARPGSVRDLLKMDDTPIVPSSLDEGGAPVPDLAGRVARDSVQRPPAPMEDSQRRLEAKILEITRDDARRGIEVPRRLVRSGAAAGTDSDRFPSLREPGLTDTAPAFRLPPSGLPSMLAGGAGILAESQRQTSERPEPDTGKPLVELEAPVSLPVLAAESEPGREPVRRAMEEVKEGRDYGFMDDLLDIELTTWRNPGEAEGYFQLRIVPKKGETIPVLPKDVTFVVDASSSIPQHKLNVTAKGVRDALRQLKPEDRFNVVVFRDNPLKFRPEAVEASKGNVAEAEKFIGNLESKGETDVYKALQPVVQQRPRDGTPGVVVVVSDGRPTAGIQDGRIIINGLTSDNNYQNGIYAFGGGRTVNRYLLDLLAYRNKGAAKVVSGIDDIGSALPEFFKTLRDPILVDLRTDMGRIDESQVFPRSMPDFFQGRAVTMYGRYRPDAEKEFSLWLAGKAGNKKKEVIFRTGFDEAREGTREIAQGWAFQKAYYIIGRISREGETPELLSELKQLRAEYGVRTSYDE